MGRKLKLSNLCSICFDFIYIYIFFEILDFFFFYLFIFFLILIFFPLICRQPDGLNTLVLCGRMLGPEQLNLWQPVQD